MSGFNILAKAIKSVATENGFESEVRNGFVTLKNTNFGVSWVSGFHFEVVTNYTNDGSWQHLRTNPVSGDYITCTLAAIKKAKYWKSKTA